MQERATEWSLEASEHSRTQEQETQDKAALAEAEKRKAAASSVFWSALLTAIKLAAGISTNSLGLLSEALHSTLDLAAAGITCLAVRVSSQPADEEHPYGHGKAESLAALAETGLLLVTCVWIVAEAVERLCFGAAPVEPSWWAFAVVCVSLLVDISRSAMLRRVARKHKSRALEADAMHFTTDIWSSAVVLGGLVCVSLASFTPEGSELGSVLTHADAVAALGVAVIVLRVSWSMAKNAVLILMDAGMNDETGRIRAALAAGAPAYAVRGLRVRESGARYFVDLVVTAPSSLRVDAAQDITAMLENIVRGVLPQAEISVQMEPEDERRDLYATSYRLASLHRLMIHSLRLVTQDDGMHAEVHVELPADMPLQEAHARVSAYEEDLCRRVGAAYVVSHIEPEQPVCSASRHAVDHGLVERTVCACTARSELRSPHRIYPRTSEEGTSVTFHCLCTTAETVATAHEKAAQLEAAIDRELPDLVRVTIHVEPAGEDR
ncbi:cation diffusion facilitator family transporter [uncultured Mailhella sp.]|uniref:cation diffusion facilitator family transporter n=1 Tax=uncultured Mailhella sp. TaxID=1981031 RepID=UPI002603B2CE|nr:cation diffusion facilitator family transporter [uncultured Mailhella sp.]